MGWIISPSEDVENYDDGSFKLPCRTSNVTYSITYVSPEGCSSNTVSYTYVTSGECETPPPPVGTCPASGDVIDPFGARDSVAVWIPIMRVLKNDTYTGYTFTSSDEGKVGSISLGSHTTGNWYLVNAQLSQNTGDYRRTTNVTVHMTGTTTPSSGCDYTVGIVQEGSCATIEQSFYLGRMNNNKISGDSQTSVGIAYVNPTSPYASWTAAFSTGTGNFVRNLTITNKPGGPGASIKVTVDIDENNTGADRTFGVVFTGTKTDGGTCSKTLEFTQAAYVPTPTCDCNSITYSGTYEDDPAPVEEQFKVQIQIHNATNNTVYWDEIELNFSDGHDEYPEHCFSCQDNTTVTWLTGNGEEYFTFPYYSPTDTLTLTSAVLHITDSSCYNIDSAVLTTTQTTWHNGDTILLQYNG